MRTLIVSRRIRITVKIERVLRFALENPTEVAFATASGLASRCEVSNATIVRAAVLFGFEDFRDFRELFRVEVREAQLGRVQIPQREQNKSPIFRN
jgi:DNA-binding MurR/RpiR family transcriptional regulator